MKKAGWAILAAGALLPLFSGAPPGAAAGPALFAPTDSAPTAGAEAPAPDSPHIRVDEDGGKTLVIKGDDPPPAAKKAEAAADGEAAPEGPPEAKPYWAAEKEEPERPYFLKEEHPETVPYWRVEESGESVPYWRATEPESERPYWLAWKPEPPPPLPPPTPEARAAEAAKIASESGRQVISYYMYQDERGVKHLTNAPADPRYRLFTVEVRVSRGLAPRNAKFTREALRGHIMDAAAVYNLDPALIAAVIQSESAFDSQAVSWAGAQGLMQLMPATARDMGCADPFDPRQNIMGGSRYLRLMLDRFGGDLTLALAAYNAGPERVARFWRVPDIPETRNYVVIVMRNYERYRPQL